MDEPKYSKSMTEALTRLMNASKPPSLTSYNESYCVECGEKYLYKEFECDSRIIKLAHTAWWKYICKRCGAENFHEVTYPIESNGCKRVRWKIKEK